MNGDEVEYLLLVKTLPGKQYEISRELRRRIKACFEKQGIEPGNPNKVYVVDSGRNVVVGCPVVSCQKERRVRVKSGTRCESLGRVKKLLPAELRSMMTII